MREGDSLAFQFIVHIKQLPQQRFGDYGLCEAASLATFLFPFFHFVVNFSRSKSATIASTLESENVRVLHCPP